jgi:hypothetical protein
MPAYSDLQAALEAVLRHPRWRLAHAAPGRRAATAADLLERLDAAAVAAAARAAGADPVRQRRAMCAEVARQLLAARVLVPANKPVDDDALLALVAGGAVAVLLLGPLSGQRLPALAGALTLAAVLGWVLWRRWSRRRSDRGGRTPSPEAR